MKRRDFIKNIAPLAVVPFFSDKLLASIPNLSMAEHALLSNASLSDDRILVVIQLNGGNDGLNMVLPIDQYTNLAAARSNVLIPDTAALMLGSHPTGLHPAMTGLKNLYDDGKLSVIQNVGYNNFNFSHFRAQDIIATGSNSNENLSSGWLGRYIEYNYPGFPSAYPSTAEPDPLALSLGSSQTTALQGYSFNTAQIIPSTFSGSITQLLGYSNTTVPTTPSGDELIYIRQQQAFANAYASRVVSAWNAGANLYTYPTAPSGTNRLGQQLSIIARLIKGGLRTKVYFASMGGFDTHSSQVDTGDHTIGTHADLLKELSDSIFAFQSDLALLGLDNRVLGMTTTEFGRRIKSNSGFGTDHGTTAPEFMFGSYVNPTVIGSNPVIPAVVATNTQLPFQTDYREMYMAVLQNWFCLTPTEANTVMGNTQIPIGAVTATCAFTVPIGLANFTVEKYEDNEALLAWTTINEQDSSHFEIQRSTDGDLFHKVGRISAAGHSHSHQTYDFIDSNLPISKYKTFYYRLKMFDLDGSFTYSDIKSVAYDSSQLDVQIKIFPNPSPNGLCNISISQSLPTDELVEISLKDSYGRDISVLQTEIGTIPTLLDFGQNIASGNYFITVRTSFKSYTLKWVVL